MEEQPWWDSLQQLRHLRGSPEACAAFLAANHTELSGAAEFVIDELLTALEGLMGRLEHLPPEMQHCYADLLRRWLLLRVAATRLDGAWHRWRLSKGVLSSGGDCLPHTQPMQFHSAAAYRHCKHCRQPLRQHGPRSCLHL